MDNYNYIYDDEEEEIIDDEIDICDDCLQSPCIC